LRGRKRVEISLYNISFNEDMGLTWEECMEWSNFKLLGRNRENWRLNSLALLINPLVDSNR
jgi:hypothetical protein